MQRDLRGTPLYQEIEVAYRRLTSPGSAGSERRHPGEPDGRTVAFRGARLDALEDSPRAHLPGGSGSGMRRCAQRTRTPDLLVARRQHSPSCPTAPSPEAQLYARDGRPGSACWRGARASSSTTNVRPTARASCCSSRATAPSRPTRSARARSEPASTCPSGFRSSSPATARTTGVARSTCSTSRAASSRRHRLPT
jgi:hypothetical protein